MIRYFLPLLLVLGACQAPNQYDTDGNIVASAQSDCSGDDCPMGGNCDKDGDCPMKAACDAGVSSCSTKAMAKACCDKGGESCDKGSEACAKDSMTPEQCAEMRASKMAKMGCDAKDMADCPSKAKACCDKGTCKDKGGCEE